MDELDSRIRSIWRDHWPALLDRIDAVEAAAEEPTPERREEARGAAHKLAGSLGSMGRADAGEVASRIEALLRDGADPDALRRLVAELRAKLGTRP